MIQYLKLVTFYPIPGNPLLSMTRIEKKWGLCKALKSNMSRMKIYPVQCLPREISVALISLGEAYLTGT
jgi:hypothetical protein